MTVALSPFDSASMAEAIYAALLSKDTTEFRQNASNRIPQGYQPTGELIQGKTGPSRTSSFAVVMEREYSGGNHKVVAIRGTQFDSMQDWLTNATIGLRPGPNAWPAHAGFVRTYNSIIKGVRTGVGSSPSIVHVCGHSLGGALAALTALDLQSRGHEAYLYTFGAPRVGPLGFTQDISRKLDNRIYRVYDRGDPVPMIPVFPFLHAPLFSSGYLVGGDRGAIHPSYHSMKDGYKAIARSAGDWAGMGRLADDGELKFGPAYWLERAGEATRIPGGAAGMWALGKALNAILKVALSAVQTGLGLAMTTLDLVAYTLSKAAQLVRSISEWVMDWLRKALRWLGMNVAVPAAEATRIFLRYVLDLFFRPLVAAARRALDLLRGQSY